MDKVRMSLGTVIQVLDELTGQTLEQTGVLPKLYLTKGKLPLYKGDGYYLFASQIEPEAVLVIEAAGYQQLEQRLEEVPGEHGIYKIYMKPDRYYPMSLKVYGVIGKAQPDTELVIVCHEPVRNRQSDGDYEAAGVPIKRIVTDGSGEFVCYWMRRKGERESISCEIRTRDGVKLESLHIQAGIRKKVYLPEGTKGGLP